MLDVNKILDRAEALVALIRQLPDPIAWARSFRASWKGLKKDVHTDKLVNGYRRLLEALRGLELNPSTFLYSVGGRPLNELSDEELRDAASLQAIVGSIGYYEADFDRVLAALTPIEDHAYREMGEVIIELRKGLRARRELLDQLRALVDQGADPRAIKKVGEEFQKLIAAMQPMRKEIRDFVNAYG